MIRLEKENKDILSFYRQPPNGEMINFTSGRHLPPRIFTVVGKDVPVRTYNLSSAPSNGHVRISVKSQGLARP